MSAPRVTALINTYNHGRFVEEAIESALSQDFPAAELEVVVVDDGSTDCTRERVAKFGDRVRYFWKANGGQSSAVNLGYEHARGGIIALLDGDDVWLPGKIRRVVETFERHPDCGLVLHKRWIWDSSGGEAGQDRDFPALSGAFPLTSTDLLRYGGTSTSALAFRKGIAQPVFPLPEGLRLLVDGYIQALLIFLAPVVTLNECLVRYRLHANNRFHFAHADLERIEHRLMAIRAQSTETRNWLEKHGFDTRAPGLAAYLARYDLIEQNCRFEARDVGRWEFFNHLRLHRKVYGPLWTRRYRAYRLLMSYAGLLLGYRRFQSLRRRHGQGGASLRLRRHLLPAGPVESLSS